MLIQAPTMSILRSRLHEVLTHCRKAGIKLSLSQMDYGSKLKFAGFVVSDKGVTANPDKVSAIRDFPTLKNVTEIRSFLGLVQQLSQFAPDLAHMTVALEVTNKVTSNFCKSYILSRVYYQLDMNISISTKLLSLSFLSPAI